MPDEWETSHGLNPNSIDDGKAVADNGYTNIENYINSLVADITTAQNEGGVLLTDQQDFSTDITHPTVLHATPHFLNLQGCEITKPSKGIYLVNGKKVVVR